MLDPVFCGITSIELVVIFLVLARLAVSPPSSESGLHTALSVLSPARHLSLLISPLFVVSGAVSWLRHNLNTSFYEASRQQGQLMRS